MRPLERGEIAMLARIRCLPFYYAPAGERKEFSVEIEVNPQLQIVSQGPPAGADLSITQ